MSNGLINGYSIAAIAAMARDASSTANAAMQRANEAYNHLPSHNHTISHSPVTLYCNGSVAGDACVVSVTYQRSSGFTSTAGN